MAQPRVSVICIFYQAERFFAEAVDSVLAQDFADYELLLCDDGSTDGGTALAKDYAARHPAKVRYLEHPGHANRGMSATRNLGLTHARGELIAFVDADDRWRPGKLREQVAILDAQPDVGMVCGAVNYWRSWEGGEDKATPTGHVADAISAPPQTSLRLYPLGTASAPPPSDLMVRRAPLDSVGGFEEHFTGPMQMYEDQACLAKLYLVTPVHFSTRTWLDYRVHDGSFTSGVLRERGYAGVRRAFLEWFAGYLAQEARPGQARLQRAVARALWRLDHPRLAHLTQLPRRAAQKVIGR